MPKKVEQINDHLFILDTNEINKIGVKYMTYRSDDDMPDTGDTLAYTGHPW